MTSMYNSIQYSSKHIKEYTVWWQANKQYCGRYKKQSTVSWPARTRVQITTVSMYKSTQHHGQHI